MRWKGRGGSYPAKTKPKDSELLDQALLALIEAVESARDLEALTQNPCEEDPDLNFEIPPGPDLPYGGDVPPDVLRLAKKMRAARGGT